MYKKTSTFKLYAQLQIISNLKMLKVSCIKFYDILLYQLIQPK